jgi:hypothetical protein
MIIQDVPVLFKMPVIEAVPELVQSCPLPHRQVMLTHVCLILPSSLLYDLTEWLFSEQNLQKCLSKRSSEESLLKWSLYTKLQTFTIPVSFVSTQSFRIQ